MVATRSSLSSPNQSSSGNYQALPKVEIEGQEKIEIVTKGGQKIILDDNSASMSMSSTGTLSIEAQGAIDIKTKGIVSLSGSQVKLG